MTQNLFPPASKAIPRSRYWGYYQRYGLGRISHNDLRYVTDELEVPFSMQSIKDNFEDLMIMMTIIRSACDVQDECNITDGPAEAMWNKIIRTTKGKLNYKGNRPRELGLLRAFHFYDKSGEQSFEIGPRLAEEFQHTDVDDILCNEITLPYKCFYLRFAGLEGQTFEGKPLDGFMIWQASELLRIYPMSSETLEPWGEISEPGRCMTNYIKVENIDSPELSFIVAANGFVAELEDMERSALKITSDGAPFTEDESRAISDNHKNARTIIMAQFQNWMKLIVNALLTIDSGGVEATQSYPEGAPANLVSKALSKGAGANKADKKLKAAGYVLLKRYEVPEQVNAGNATNGDRTVSPHWRRGHWRRQHYGPGMVQTKRIRIAPTIVMGTSNDTKPRKGYRIEA